MEKKNFYLCVHGHFYQPPRENPWTEKIELQETAAPYHDWNQRIHHECYLPNAMARVLDNKGLIVDIVNNYEKISFNIGPTLLLWIQTNDPDTYRRILEADRKSGETNGGHGNAIAQAYNHMILPLSNHRDKVTQVKWGVEEFVFRFSRRPESIWLPETACNPDTLEVLIEENIRYIILEPHQAEAVRAIAYRNDEHKWQDVSLGSIDPKYPYRYFSRKSPNRFIDIFFYDGPISKDIGFGDLLFDAKSFIARIQTAETAEGKGGLIHMATDGESYGHHKGYGERALAYMLNIEAPKRGYGIVNYGWYLDHFPPRFEVRLKAGENGEGTSWSCAHGVKRWKENCGCRGDGPASWKQHWRKPLRDALDWLRDRLAPIYEEQGKVYLRDVWDARDGYVHVVLNRTVDNIRAFMIRYQTRDLTWEETLRVMKLLEMQRQAMLMYTSCGWFFTELSGIETVQILAYAARAIEYAEELTGQSLEREFLEHLAKAKSNVEDFGNGKIIYERFVKPQRIAAADSAGFFGILSVFNGGVLEIDRESFYGYKVQVAHERRESFGDLTLNFSACSLESVITRERKDFIFIVVRMGAYDVRCSVKSAADSHEAAKMERELFEELHSLHIVEILRKIDGFFGEKYYSLRSLPLEQRKKIVASLSKEMLSKISDDYEMLFDQNRKMSEIYRSINLPIPDDMKAIAAHTLEKRLYEEVVRLAEQGFNPKKMIGINRVLRDAKAFDVELKKTEVVLYLSEELKKRVKQLEKEVTSEAVSVCLNISKLAAKIKISKDQREVQDCLFFLLKEWTKHRDAIPPTVRENPEQFLSLLSDFHISSEHFSSLLEGTAAKKS